MVHVAAVLDPSIKGERLFCSSRPFIARTIVDTLRQLYPDVHFSVEVPKQVLSNITVDDKVPLQLLKKWAGREAWISWEQTVRDGVVLDRI